MLQELGLGGRSLSPAHGNLACYRVPAPRPTAPPARPAPPDGGIWHFDGCANVVHPIVLVLVCIAEGCGTRTINITTCGWAPSPHGQRGAWPGIDASGPAAWQMMRCCLGLTLPPGWHEISRRPYGCMHVWVAGWWGGGGEARLMPPPPCGCLGRGEQMGARCFHPHRSRVARLLCNGH